MKTYWPIGVALILFLTHLTFLPNGFTWLDHGDIELGRAIVPLVDLPQAFLSQFGVTGFYRPMVTLIHSADYAVYGLWAPGFHLTNVILHVAVALITPVFLTVFFPLTIAEQVLAALIIGVHPISWLPVGAISYRQELLVLLFSMLTTMYHAKARTHGKITDAAIAVLALFAGAASKETALLLIPLFIFLWEWVSPIKKHMKRLFMAEAAAVAATIFFRFLAVPELWRTPAIRLALPDAVDTRLAAVGRLFLTLLSPFQTGLTDATRVVPVWDIRAIATGIMLVAAIFFLFFRTRKSLWRAPVFLLIVPLVPALNIIPLPRFFSIHYAYASLPGFALSVIFLKRSYTLIYKNVLFTIVLILWLSIASVTTWQAGKQFFDDRALFAPEVARDDLFAEGHQYLGDYYFKSDQYTVAEDHYQKALRRDPGVIAFVDRPSVLNNLAGVYLFQNKLIEADQTLILLSQFPGWDRSPTLRYNRALIARQRGDWQTVVDLLNNIDKYQRVSKINDLYQEGLKHLGTP